MKCTCYCLFSVFFLLGFTSSETGAIQLELSVTPTEITTSTEENIGPIHCNCIGGCPPDVTPTWVHPNGHQDRLLFRNNGTLMVTHITLNDDGVYNCTAVEEDGQVVATTSFRLKVFGVSFGPENKGYWVLKAGETLGPISCNVSMCDSGEVTNCRYTWKKFKKAGATPTDLNYTQELEIKNFDHARDQAYYRCEVTNGILTTKADLFARTELYCYQCSSSTGKDNDCKDHVKTMRRNRILFTEEGVNTKLKYITSCNGNSALLYCLIETVEIRGDTKAYIRGCSDGETFPYALPTITVFATPDNQTKCGSQRQGYQVCVRLCEGDFCNGPLKAGNIRASLLMTMLLVIFTCILESLQCMN